MIRVASSNPALLKLLLIALLVAVAVSTLLTQNRYTNGDSRATLVLSESILYERSLKLDHLGEEAITSLRAPGIYLRNDIAYYGFPVGTPLLSAPFVFMLNLAGLEAQEDEPLMQLLIVALSSVLSFIMLVRIAGLYHDRGSSLLLATIFWFGTSFSSTLSTALWSHNFAVLAALVAVFYSLKLVRTGDTTYWLFIALALFIAYLCRPTLSLLAPFIVLHVASRDWRVAAKITLGFFLCFAVFVMHSFYEFNQILPDYYMPSRLADDSQFWLAFYGNLLSPARGLFVYSPFLLFAVLICVRHATAVLGRLWYLLALLWPLIHLVTISGFEHWWGGGSFGSRFMVDVLPGLFLLLIAAWSYLRHHSRLMFLVMTPLIIFSVFVHTVQGLFNPLTASWNAAPHIDRNPEYIFDWSYPQFAANALGHEHRLFQHNARQNVLPVRPGIPELHNSERLVFSRWSDSEETIRWNNGQSGQLGFVVESMPVSPRLLIAGHTLGDQRVTIRLNQQQIYSAQLRNFNDTLAIDLHQGLLVTGMNLLQFEFPDARVPGNGDPRELAFAFRSLTLE